MHDLTREEEKLFRSLNSPAKIQDFLNTLTMRADEREPIVRSPRVVVQKKAASCIEGALFAYAVLHHHKRKAYLLDLRVDPHARDVDHVVCLFKQDGLWGAISKTSHAVLRYREPVYKTPRELAMSYFHEYFTDDGHKTLRSFSKPFQIEAVAQKDWITTHEDLYEIAAALDAHPHIEILTKKQVRSLRPADILERKAGKLKD